MRNFIPYFTALVPFRLDCHLQNPAYIGHCPGVVSSHGIISWWVACSRRSDERRMQVASGEQRENINNKRNRNRNHFMNCTMRGRGGRKRRWINYNMDKSWGGGGGGVLPYKRLMGMCRWMGSHFHDWIDCNGVAFSIEFTRMVHTFSDFSGVRKFFFSKRTRMFVL